MPVSFTTLLKRQRRSSKELFKLFLSFIVPGKRDNSKEYECLIPLLYLYVAWRDE